MSHKKIFIAGCGYVGQQLALQLSPEYTIRVMVRTKTSQQLLEPLYPCIRMDLDNPSPLPDLALKNTSVFYFVPPPANGTTDKRLSRFLQCIDPAQLPDNIILISTTGVYGDCADEWVDEMRNPHPDTDRARRRLAAESTLAHWARTVQRDYRVLRVPGIYGAGKLPVKRLQENRPILSLDQSPWSNRIHIDDLVQACQKALEYTGKYHIFNVSDGHPSSMSDFFIQVANIMNLPEPEQISLDACKQVFSENMMSYLLESKKISNKRMLEELQVTLKYPTLAQGLAAIKQTI